MVCNYRHPWTLATTKDQQVPCEPLDFKEMGKWKHEEVIRYNKQKKERSSRPCLKVSDLHIVTTHIT